VTIVHGVDHTSATLRSQSARVSDPNQYTERTPLTPSYIAFHHFSRHYRPISSCRAGTPRRVGPYLTLR